MRLRSAFLASVILTAPAFAATEPAKPPSRLIMPDGSVLQLPQTEEGFGPDGPQFPSMPDGLKPPVALNPQGARPAQPDSKSSPAPPASAAERRRQQLDELYTRLARSKDQVEATAIAGMIGDVMLRSGSDTADLLMQRAVAAMEAKELTTATALLDKVITLQPRWAEAWNKRATVRYLEDDDAGSMADIEQVLSIEPRHFGALSGMGLILHRNGEDKAALTVLRRAEDINPQDAQVKTLVEELTPKVEGEGI